MTDAAARDHEKKIAAEAAVARIEEGMVVGLGTGSTAAFAVKALGARVRAGFRVTGIPTSEATRMLAELEGIPLVTFDEVSQLDLCIDGADEADTRLNLTKGGGGALLREKVVAYASRRFLVIMDQSKLVEHLHAFPLPVEVVPFAMRVVGRRVEELGGQPVLRSNTKGPFITDNGNWILDCRFPPITDPARLADELGRIPGVAEHGLFINLASELIVGRGTNVDVYTSKGVH